MAHGQIEYYEDVELGHEIGPLEEDISDESVVAFCEVTGATMPNRFTDAEIAKRVRLSGPIVPGIMSMAIMARLLKDWSPKGVLKHFDVVFRQPVPHTSVSISALVTDKREEDGEYLVECDVYLSNEESGRMIGGRAIVSLPSRG